MDRRHVEVAQVDAAFVSRLLQRFSDDFSLTPVTASEIEFYLHGSQNSPHLAGWQQDVAERCAAENIAIHRIEKEMAEKKV